MTMTEDAPSIRGVRALMIFNGRTPAFPPAFNLASVWSNAGGIFTFVNMAAERDHEESLLGSGRLISLKASPSFVHWPLLRYTIAFLVFFIRLRRLAATQKPDVLLGCWGGGYLLARMLRWSGSKAKVIFWAQEYIQHNELKRFDLLRQIVRIERYLARSADLTVVADPTRGKYQCAYLKTNNWMAIRNVPPAHKLTEGPSSLREFIGHLRLEQPGKSIFIFVGSICAGALVPNIIESFPEWPVNTLLVFVGSVDKDIPDFHDRIKKHPGRIYYLARMDYGEVMRGLPEADAGIAFYNVDQPWLNERYCAPCKVGDYLKAGLPALLSCNETLVDLCAEHPVGVIVDPRDIQSIASGVHRLNKAIVEGRITKDKIIELFERELSMEQQCAPLFSRINSWVLHALI